MLDFVTQKSNSEVSKSYSNILVENNFSLENYVTSEGAVSHNVFFFTINSSPLLVTKYVFMLTTILGNYQ